MRFVCRSNRLAGAFMAWVMVWTAISLACGPAFAAQATPVREARAGKNASPAHDAASLRTDANAIISQVHYSTTPKRLRVVFWLDRPVKYRVFLQNNPEQVVVDIGHARLQADIRGYFVRNAVVSGISGKRASDGLRLSLPLKEEVRLRPFLMNRGPGKVYLVVDLLRQAREPAVASVSASGGKLASRPDGKPVAASPARPHAAGKGRAGTGVVKISADKTGAANLRAVRGRASEATLFWAVLQRLDRALRDIHRPHQASRQAIDRLFSIDCADIGLLADKGRALREEARASADDPGLDLEGGIRKGLDWSNSGVSSGSRQSAFIGLKWDFLNGGWRENRGRARWYALRADQADVLARMEYEDRLNQCRADRIPDAFLPWEHRLLSLKADLLRRVLPALRRAYLRGDAFLEDALEAEQELQTTGNDLAAMRPRLAGFSRRSLLFPTMYPLIDVDMEAVLRALDADGLLHRSNELAREIKAQKRENASTTRLYAFLRYEADGSGFRRRGPAAGLRFDIPLFENTTAGVRYWREASRARGRQMLEARKRDARHAWRKFVEERERVIRQWHRYHRVMERLRRSRLDARLDADTADARAAAERALEAVDAAIELARAEALLYRRASEIFSYAHVLYRPEFIRVSALTDGDWRMRPGRRAVYLWSKTFNAMPNDVILAFLRAKQARQVLLSAGAATDWGKARDFIRRARRDRIIVTPMFANNRWLEKGGAARASRAILSRLRPDATVPVRMPEDAPVPLPAPGLQSLGGEPVSFETGGDDARTGVVRTGFAFAHLDIEPQAIKRYRHDKRGQAEALISLLRELRARLPGRVRLSASVPVTWSSSAYEQLSRFADRLYLMDYGSRDPAVLIRRLEAARAVVPADRLVVALRASDFATEAEMERAVKAIRARTGLGRFAIHALRDYLRLAGANALGADAARPRP